jgi:hypothetical protein
MFGRARAVSPGERFRAIEVPGIAWEVEEVAADPLGNQHARLVLVGDRSTRRTLACARLLDERRWRRLPPS